MTDEEEADSRSLSEILTAMQEKSEEIAKAADRNFLRPAACDRRLIIIAVLTMVED